MDPSSDQLITQTRRLSLESDEHATDKQTSFSTSTSTSTTMSSSAAAAAAQPPRHDASLERLPNELLLHILTFLDIPDLLATTRLNHHLRALSTTPVLHAYRLRQTRLLLPPSLDARPPLSDLIQKHIFLTPTTVVSKRLARSLVSIRLSRKLSARPKPQDLVQRAVLPQECVPRDGAKWEAPAIVQRKRTIERERIKDGLRRWLEGRWLGEKGRRENEVRRWEEEWGVGRVWRLRRFWERVGRGGNGIGVR